MSSTSKLVLQKGNSREDPIDIDSLDALTATGNGGELQLVVFTDIGLDSE